MLALLAIGVEVYARTQLIFVVALLLLGIADQQLAVLEREWRRLQ